MKVPFDCSQIIILLKLQLKRKKAKDSKRIEKSKGIESNSRRKIRYEIKIQKSSPNPIDTDFQKLTVIIFQKPLRYTRTHTYIYIHAQYKFSAHEKTSGRTFREKTFRKKEAVNGEERDESRMEEG